MPQALSWLSKQAQRLPAAYSHCLTHHHLMTESVTAGCMAGLGDYLAQRRQVQPNDTVKASYNLRRGLSFILKGLGEGVLWSIWYHWADRWVANALSSSSSSTMTMMNMMGLSLNNNTPMYIVMRTVLSLLLDTCLACPIIYAAWDIPLPALLSGVPWRHIPRQVSQKLGTMIVASLQVWIPANILIYNIPLKYRLIVASCTDVVWQSIVSSIVTSNGNMVVEQEEDLELAANTFSKDAAESSVRLL
jgi:Mpv17 / PMP22 family